MKTYTRILNVVLTLALIKPQTANTMVEKQPLPTVNVAAVQTHHTELVGKTRVPASLKKKQNKALLKRAISNLVLEETQIGLPEAERIHAVKIARTIIETANQYEMDPLFLVAVIRHESYFNPNQVGLFKEEGLMQIKPDTAAWLNEKLNLGYKKINLFDPTTNIKIGAAYFNYLRGKFDKNSNLYVAAYNMGPKNVKKLLSQNQKPRVYGEKVMKLYAELIDSLQIQLMQEPFPRKVAKN